MDDVSFWEAGNTLSRCGVERLHQQGFLKYLCHVGNVYYYEGGGFHLGLRLDNSRGVYSLAKKIKIHSIDDEIFTLYSNWLLTKKPVVVDSHSFKRWSTYQSAELEHCLLNGEWVFAKPPISPEDAFCEGDWFGCYSHGLSPSSLEKHYPGV